MRHGRVSYGGSVTFVAILAFVSSVHEQRTEAEIAARTAAHAAHLRYVSDERPGIRRERSGEGWRYIAPSGDEISDEPTLARIATLAIPPAWSDVWICPLANGHLQATGRDTRGRKQYRYHVRWRSVRDETKYERMLAFGRALPAIRAHMQHDLALPGLPRNKVLAAVVALLDRTALRVGDAEYARQNGSFGLTTLRNRHVNVAGTEIRFHFRAKSGKQRRISLRNRRLARIVQRCRDLPGYELFQYLDEAGERHAIDAADVNAYLRTIAGQEFTAKDFRTWHGTLAAAAALRSMPACASAADAKQNELRAIEAAAARLGNTTAVCRNCYIHPAVLDAYRAGELTALPSNEAGGARLSDAEPCADAEAALLLLLEQHAADSAVKPPD